MRLVSRPRIGPFFAALAAASVVAGGSAAAEPPTAEPTPFTFPAVLDAGFTTETGDTACEFAVAVDVLANQEVTRTFYDADGNVTRQITTGRLVVEFSRVDDPSRTFLARISGPAIVTFDGGEPATLVATGVGGGPSPYGLVTFAGRLVIDLTTGTVVSEPTIRQDVCAALA